MSGYGVSSMLYSALLDFGSEWSFAFVDGTFQHHRVCGLRNCDALLVNFSFPSRVLKIHGMAM